MSALRYVLFTVLLMSPLLPSAAHAEEWINQGEERFTLGAGVFLPAFETKARVDSLTRGIGDEIDLHDVLGFEEDQTTFYGNASWRFLPRHRISFSYFRFKDESSATALRDLQIGDEIYPVGASLNSDFKIHTYPFMYSYSFIKRDNLEFAGTLGFHWYRIDFNVAGSASLGEVGFAADTSASTNSPLPLVGLRFDYHFTDKWTVGAHGEAFSMDVDELSGSLVNLTLKTDYWFSKHFGAGIAVNWFNLDVDVDDSKWIGNLDYNYWGPQVYLKYRF